MLLWNTDDAGLLLGEERREAIDTIETHHYTHSVPSGKSHYVAWDSAIVCWAIPANKNIGRFLLGRDTTVWELSRLWAPDGHRRNLLTEAIAYAIKVLTRLEHPEILVSYADPNAGHSGGVYRAASWIFLGQCDESRAYRDCRGQIIARRAFHSGSKGMTKQQIMDAGYIQLRLPGKFRFAKPLSRKARRELPMRFPQWSIK
jgi:hypothetical protein